MHFQGLYNITVKCSTFSFWRGLILAFILFPEGYPNTVSKSSLSLLLCLPYNRRLCSTFSLLLPSLPRDTSVCHVIFVSFQAVYSGELQAFDWGNETKNLEKGNQVRKTNTIYYTHTLLKWVRGKLGGQFIV